MGYKTIKHRGEASFIEKRSEFIGRVCPVTSEEEAVAFISEIRAANRKATHNCYAYILRDNNISRHSDDGEPGGTAGAPILDALQKAGVTDIVCVVTRYFGGILLGAGGLVRAYSKSAALALGSVDVISMELSDSIRAAFSYSYYGSVSALITAAGGMIRDTQYADGVEIFADIKTEDTEGLFKKLTDACAGNIELEVLSSGYREF
ncbi:MAG: YigZ family protein [Eubacterium sp.]|nr:YigZ family protein [Eubacterium sp.]